MAAAKKSWIQRFKESESSASVIFGAIVVIVLGILLFNFARSNRSDISLDGESIEGEQVESPTGKMLPTEHIVVAGDHLWSIAEDYYGSGFFWVDIAEANDLEEQSALEVGMKLAIPIASFSASAEEQEDVVVSPTVAPSKAETVVPAAEETVIEKPQAGNSITGQVYEVKPGDSLWTISQRAYGDGYRWTEIFNANKELIANPDLIFVGWNLTLPR
jgi:nucleoid-associated protein YgaU